MIKLEKDIIHQLHSDREVSFRYDLLNYNETKIGELTSLGGSLGLNSLSQMKRKGRFSFREDELKDIDWLNDKVQPVFILNNQYEFKLGVFMISSPTRTLKNKEIFREVECFDTSLVLLEDKFDTRYRVIKGTNYITAIEQIISSAGIWKINIPFINAKIKTDREFEIGTSKLEAVNYLLDEINYTSIWVDELGNFTANPYILPNDRIVEYSYKNDDMSIILPDSSVEEIDLFSVPNKWVVVATNPETDPLVSRFTNENGGSPTSTVNRRRIIVDFREVDDIASQSILDEYVRRIAYEASNVYGKFIFDTAIMPHHSYMDALYCEHTDLGIKNKYIETSWEMDLKANGKMRHNARHVIQL
ncbi:hypothetical protein KQI41_01240 [Tissierella pigra]|uniref:hypothetical protein n=1 Tax=Tissierella pigra TaxID=2607614 RepID=UPI001C11A86D|nr:hypothetical protein [Tissierella pigra]MBU5425020.1 hypothetical protein [Tissierella pigra]